jgi:diguanylate cyclase (GGDEF)-like protein
VAVILIDEDTKELRIKISRQISYTFAKKFRKYGPSATAETVVLQQQPLLLNDLSPSSDAYADLKLEHEFSSAVLAPIIKDQRGIGYIFCDRANGEKFDESDLLHLQVIGYLIGNMIQKFELILAGKKLSQIDDASHALQYKAFIPMLDTELKRAITHRYPVVLALISVQAFRKYIETYGIDEAHALLAEVVAVVKTEIRDMDILARFAADEFILCLSGTTKEEAQSKLGAIRAAVSHKVAGQGDAAIDVTIGALTLATREAQQQRLQDILSTLGKSLVDAKNQKSSGTVIADL